MADDGVSAATAWALIDILKPKAVARQPDGVATVTRVDKDGTVWVRLSNSTIDTPANGSVVSEVAAGDSVSYKVESGKLSITGNLSDPAVGREAATNVAAKVVRPARRLAGTAQQAADAAARVAKAIGQHFWHDDNGAHISTEAGNPAGARNAIWNSLGMLFRAGTSNLLALVTGEDPGMDVYDGGGNEAENIIAALHGSGARIGPLSGLHSLLSAAGFVVAYATDKVFGVSTDGITTEVYAGGSTIPTGVYYTNASVVAVLDYLNDGCTPFVGGDEAYVQDAEGDHTGYTLDGTDLTALPHVLDGLGHRMTSAHYDGIYWDSDASVWELDQKLVPMAETDAMPTHASVGGVSATLADKHMALTADNLTIDWDGRVNGHMLGDPTDAEDERYGTDDQSSNLALDADTGKAVCSHAFAPGTYLVTGHVSFAANASGHRAINLLTTAGSLPNAYGTMTQWVPAVSGHRTHLSVMLLWSPATTQTLYLNALSSVALTCQGQMRWVKLL